MNFQQSTPRRIRSGFSLLEIVVVLGFAGVILGTAVFMIGTPKAEQALREEHAKIENFVRQGRALAVTYQQPFVVELLQGEVRLRPYADPQQASRYETEETQASSLKPLNEQEWPRVEMIDEEYEMSVRRWGLQDALVLEEKKPLLWILEPQGLCEPLSIRLSKDFGDISLARVYHPLTGVAEDEEMTITVNK